MPLILRQSKIIHILIITNHIWFLSAQLWRFEPESGADCRKLETRVLSEMGQKWQFQSYEWSIRNDVGSVEAPVNTDEDCKQKNSV